MYDEEQNEEEGWYAGEKIKGVGWYDEEQNKGVGWYAGRRLRE